MPPPRTPPADSCWTSPTPETTRAAARALAEAAGNAIGSGDGTGNGELLTIALCGGLGAGKTSFAQGLAEGLGLDPAQVTSPTFTIASEYPLERGGWLVHLDLYRVESASELEAIGFVAGLEPGNVLAIEWADRCAASLPTDRLWIEIDRSGLADVAEVGDASPPVTPRRLRLAAGGPVSSGVLERWERALTAGIGLARDEGD